MSDEPSTNLHPEIKRVVDKYNASNPPVAGIDSAQEIRRVAQAAFIREPPLEHDQGTERIIEIPRTGPAGGTIEARLILPAQPASTLPLLTWFHGGGWVLGSAEQATKICRTLMHHSKAAILNVDYRLAPEHPYPAAVEDCFDAVRWITEHAASLGIDPQRIGVGGSSAGANLAAACTLAARDGALPKLHMQCLLYPVLDADFETPSYHAYATGLVLERDAMMWFWDQYCPDLDQRSEWKAAPARAERLTGLCPTHLVIAEHDVLCSENEHFAQRLMQEGVPLTTQWLHGAIHGALTMCPESPTMANALKELGCQIRIHLDA